ncbi:MAG TPA: hypothetical protein VF163_04985 [Micromonosporaceae bacterium]
MPEPTPPLHPPADPWDSAPTGGPDDISATPFMYGRAPVPAVPPREPTTELPELTAVAGPGRRPTPAVSWQRTSRASRRSLSDGWGFTATGLVVVFCGWGIWAAALRGTGTSAWAGLVFVVAVAAGVFALARFFGYLVVEQVLRRPRLHARWAHFLTGLFLTVAGVSYLVNTPWLTDAGDGVRIVIDWVAKLARGG